MHFFIRIANYSGSAAVTNFKYIYITWLFAYCKGGNLNIHIWAWFGYFIC